MTKKNLSKIAEILPFNDKYVLVGKKKYANSKTLVWNLMDKDGRLLSDNWFASISKNSDGSIKTEVKATARAKKVTEVTFLNTESFAKACNVMSLVPVACLSLVDSGSIEPYTGNDKRFIAKAKLYGQVVFLDKDGNVYKDGVKLRLLFNTVDSERLFKATWAFNKKLHYECKPLPDNTSNIVQLVNDNKVAMWCFYWVDPTWSVTTDHKELVMQDVTKKWTDDLIVRIARDLVPDSVKELLTKSLGCGDDGEMSGVKYRNYRMKKSDLEKIINTLAAA